MPAQMDLAKLARMSLEELLYYVLLEPKGDPPTTTSLLFPLVLGASVPLLVGHVCRLVA